MMVLARLREGDVDALCVQQLDQSPIVPGWIPHRIAGAAPEPRVQGLPLRYQDRRPHLSARNLFEERRVALGFRLRRRCMSRRSSRHHGAQHD